VLLLLTVNRVIADGILVNCLESILQYQLHYKALNVPHAVKMDLYVFSAIIIQALYPNLKSIITSVNKGFNTP